MDITVETPSPATARFRLSGELVIGACPHLREKINEWIRPEIKAMIFDLSEVRFVDSAGLGLLIQTRQILGDQEIQMRLTGVNARILPLFKLTRLDRLFGLDGGNQTPVP